MSSKKFPNLTSTDTQDDFLQQLYSRRGGIKLGLGRVADAFPVIFEKSIPVYHVAGTNGKGTAVYSLDHILRSNGLKTGRFISPHLFRYNERISIDGADIADPEVREIYEYLEKKINDFSELSFFEVTFLIAWKYFEISGCDRAVFEVGLGGRLDATNVIEGPKTDIITSIGLDHTHILGDTLEKIALEKLGIVKKGDKVLIGGSADNAFDKWMAEVALSKGAASVDDDSLDLDIAFPPSCMSPEQKKNVRLAVKAALLGEGKGLKIPDFSEMKIPARFEFIEPDIVTDVAHNPPAISSLAKTVSEKIGKVVVLYGAMKDKDITQVLDLIGGISDDIFVINLEADNDRGAKVGDILDRAGSKVSNKIKYGKTDEKTIEEALSFARKNGKKLLVTGSFHTVEKFMNFREKLLR
jgi:dihydrofolate synthase/folylpolyglutamate synthase